MATYADLVLDVRGHARAAPQGVSDKHIARLLWRGVQRVVREAAELAPQSALLPRSSSTVASPADFTDGYAIPTTLKLATVWLTLSTGARRECNVVPEYVRWADVEPRPAAYIANGTLYPIPGRTLVPWTHANIANDGGWTDVSSVTFEHIPAVTAPTAMTDTMPGDDLLHDAAVWWAVFSLTKSPADHQMHAQELERVLANVARIQPAGTETVVDVRG